MTPLYEALTGTDHGALPRLMAEQFSLSQKQAQAAISALTPAFTEGLKRQSQTPASALDLLSTIGAGQHLPYAQDVSRAFQPQGLQHGQMAVDQLFRNMAVNEAIVEQSARATGLPETTIRQILPVIGAVVMGAVARQMTDALAQQARLVGPMMGGRASEPKPQAEPAKTDPLAANPWLPFMNEITRQQRIFADAMMAGWASASPAEAKREPTPPPKPRAGANAFPLFNDNFAEMMDAFFGRRPGAPDAEALNGGVGNLPPLPRAQQPAETPAPPEKDQTAPNAMFFPRFDTALAPFFEAGRQISESQVKAMESIFERHGTGHREDEGGAETTTHGKTS